MSGILLLAGSYGFLGGVIISLTAFFAFFFFFLGGGGGHLHYPMALFIFPASMLNCVTPDLVSLAK